MHMEVPLKLFRLRGLMMGTNEKRALGRVFSCVLAEWTGLEPATPGVTGLIFILSESLYP